MLNIRNETWRHSLNNLKRKQLISLKEDIVLETLGNKEKI